MHGEHATARHEAIDRLDLACKTLQHFISEDAAPMCAGEYAQGAIRRSGVVKVNAQRENSVERGRGCMRVEHAGLYRPRSPARHVRAFAHFDGVPARVAYDNLRAAAIEVLSPLPSSGRPAGGVPGRGDEPPGPEGPGPQGPHAAPRREPLA